MPWVDGDKPYSEETAREIDVEVTKIISDATDEVRGILLGRRAALEAVAQRLIEKEVIDGSELRGLLEATVPGPKLVPGTAVKPAPATPTRPAESAGTPGDRVAER